MEIIENKDGIITTLYLNGKLDAYYSIELEKHINEVIQAGSNKEELFGEKRLYKLIKTNSNLNAEEMVNKIKDTVISFSQNQSQFDDITLMVIKVE
ncbi:MAG: SpoIIE family protein phosphatase [Methanobacterium sp.]